MKVTCDSVGGHVEASYLAFIFHYHDSDMGGETLLARQRSTSPSVRPAAVILEWNFMASRINAVVAMMRAHKQYNIPVNLQKVADGMAIESVR